MNITFSALGLPILPVPSAEGALAEGLFSLEEAEIAIEPTVEITLEPEVLEVVSEVAPELPQELLVDVPKPVEGQPPSWWALPILLPTAETDVPPEGSAPLMADMPQESAPVAKTAPQILAADGSETEALASDAAVDAVPETDPSLPARTDAPERSAPASQPANPSADQPAAAAQTALPEIPPPDRPPELATEAKPDPAPAPEKPGPERPASAEPLTRRALAPIAHAVAEAAGLPPPPEKGDDLGRLQVMLHRDGETMHITIVAERPETLEMMRRHADQLQLELQQEGFAQTDLSFAEWGDPEEQEEDKRSSAPAPPSEPIIFNLPAPSAKSGLDMRI